MKMLVVNRNSIVLTLAMMLLIYGIQNFSYGQMAPVVEAGDDDSKHKHDGFYLRLTTGIGSSTSSEKVEGEELSISGVSGNTTLGVGYAVVENLILNLDIFGNLVDNPTVEINGAEIGEANAELSISNIGIGATYYIMPANVYLTGSIALASGTLESYGQKIESDAGYGINVAVGKEWWVSDNWGIGIAGQLFHTVLSDEQPITGEVTDLKTTSFGILFSATFN